MCAAESHDPNDSDEQEKVEHEEEEEEPIEKGEESDTEKDKWDEEKEWAELQESVRRDKEADRHGNTSESPIVHAPFYPLVSIVQSGAFNELRKCIIPSSVGETGAVVALCC